MVVNTKQNGAYVAKTGEGLNVTASTNAVLHADMKFLVSKVRYTLLFDNTSDEMSKKNFAGKSWELTGVSASKIYDSPYSLDNTVNTSATDTECGNLPYPEKTYPGANVFPYTTDTNPNTNQVYTFVDLDNMAENATPKPYNQRCFQGTFYFPANPDDHEATTLAFEAKEQHRKGDNIDDGVALSYTMPLLPGDGNGRL